MSTAQIRSSQVQTPLQQSVLRIGLACTGAVLYRLAWDLWVSGRVIEYPGNLVLSFAVWCAGSALLLMTLVRITRPEWAWFILPGLCTSILLNYFLNKLNYAPLTASFADNAMIGQYAVEALKRGENPYSWNFTDFLRVFQNGISYTPVLDGSAQYRLTYPILPTLVLWLFDAIGLGQATFVSLVFNILLLCLMFVRAPAHLRPLVLVPMFILRPLTFYAFFGVQDVVWSVLIVAVIVFWDRHILSAILFGLAATFRQQPWFILPFLLIVILNSPGPRNTRIRRAVQFSLIAGGIFLALNLPFILWDPKAWVLGAFEPSYAPFNVFSEGLASVTSYGLLNLPRTFYTLLQISVLVGGMIVLARHVQAFGQAFWILPGLFFWVYYRGLANYWVYWIPPLIMATSLWLEGRGGVIQTALIPRRWLLTAALLLAIAFADTGVMLFYLRQPSPIEADLRGPVIADDGSGSATDLTLTVTNRGYKAFAPRFAVQHDPNRQALPWPITSGPEFIDPGQTAEYVISAGDFQVSSFGPETGGQIIVSDAGGDYTYRAVVSVEPDPNAFNPDALQNSAFTYWSRRGEGPRLWTLQPAPGNQVTLTENAFAGRRALRLQVSAQPERTVFAPNRLSQTTVFPDVLELWIYPQADEAHPETEIYGVSIADPSHELWVLFGDTNDQGTFTGDGNRAWLSVRAARNAWSLQTIRVRDLYQQFGWPPPMLSLASRGGQTVMRRLVQVSLIAASRQRTNAGFVFGPIIQHNNPDSVLSDAIEHPDEYYLLTGDLYRDQRNADLAIEAYRTALAYAARGAHAGSIRERAYSALAEISLRAGRWAEATDEYRAALLSGTSNAALTRSGLAWALFRGGDPASAQVEILAAWNLLNSGPASYTPAEAALIYSRLGWIAVAQQDSWSAAGAFGSAIGLTPSDAYLYLGLAASDALQGDTTQVRAALQNALKLSSAVTETPCADYKAYMEQLGISAVWGKLSGQCSQAVAAP